MTEQEHFMGLALEEAKKALQMGEVPVGAVVVQNGQVLASTHNLRETLHDVSAHAEVLALRLAGEALSRWQLDGCELYVTLEPCAMCAAAIAQSRIDALYFGAFDEKAGCCGSVYKLPADPRMGVYIPITGGIREQECRAIMDDFFQKRRAK